MGMKAPPADRANWIFVSADPASAKTPEHRRLEEARTGEVEWKSWGPYLSERQWATVREDQSADGDAWNSFPHDHARSRAYRWGEDGIAGICDDRQRLCLALALWNGADPILKERMFGLNNQEGNHGEDVKEYWFYLDSTPTHSYLKCQYKYPQRAFPYDDLVSTNARRGKLDMEYELMDTGIFDDDRYFDVIVEYAKATHDDIVMRVTAHNRGPDPATLHLLPTLWFRNTWSWGNEVEKPVLGAVDDAPGIAAVRAHHPGARRVAAACRCSGAAALLRERDRHRAPVRCTERLAVRQGCDRPVRGRGRSRRGQPRTDGHQGSRTARADDRRGREREHSTASDGDGRRAAAEAPAGSAARPRSRSRARGAPSRSGRVLRDGDPGVAAP